jgi:hypothetical protein
VMPPSGASSASITLGLVASLPAASEHVSMHAALPRSSSADSWAGAEGRDAPSLAGSRVASVLGSLGACGGAG